MRLVLATANLDKAAEIAAVLVDHELVPRPMGIPEVVEDAGTLEGNARLKARAVCEATGEPAVADDTGLEVEALDGGPGVWSARFAGPEATYAANVGKLVAELEGVPGVERGARFRTVALLARPDGSELMAEGVVDGVIADEPRGEEGFGYDPLFVPLAGQETSGTDGPVLAELVRSGRTFAQMGPEEKHALSHRGRAFRALAELLTAMDRPPPPD